MRLNPIQVSPCVLRGMGQFMGQIAKIRATGPLNNPLVISTIWRCNVFLFLDPDMEAL